MFSFQSDPIGAYLAAFMPTNYQDHAAYMDGENEITYWIARAYWGKGISTKVLEIFLGIESSRPLIARVAFDNYGSQQVLEKCGFVRTGKEKGYAVARQEEIEEYIYCLL